MRKRTYSRPYVGIKRDGGTPDIFRSVGVPTRHSHGEYSIIRGPFHTLRGARFMANNPTYRGQIWNAEKLAKKITQDSNHE